MHAGDDLVHLYEDHFIQDNNKIIVFITLMKATFSIFQHENGLHHLYVRHFTKNSIVK